ISATIGGGFRDIRAPHFWQKTASAEFSELQTGHCIRVPWRFLAWYHKESMKPENESAIGYTSLISHGQGAGMQYRPSLEEFMELARHASMIPVYRQLIGDTLTPVSAFCKVQEGDWSFLFESVIGGERLGRYSFVGSGPFVTFQAFDRHVQIES